MTLPGVTPHDQFEPLHHSDADLDLLNRAGKIHIPY